ncbi:ATP-binding cassette sub-family C member 2 [Aduncisulcus paluster]|uniref:ATP-binding cassette sub-family C member 2 n=1 Tax=Aduncisulcus paluster TaxID=2918883 RepID=A0ABQ5KID4_9EUKA|nr:ATP-binding cassette sub-family C member 2 [Aduncisulcus paluster]
MVEQELSVARSPSSPDMEDKGDSETVEVLENVEIKHNMFVNGTFSWLSPLFHYAKKNGSMEVENMPDIKSEWDPKILNKEFVENFEKTKTEKKRFGSVPRTFFAMNKLRYALAIPFSFIYVGTQFLPSIFLKKILTCIYDRALPSPTLPFYEGFIYAGILMVGALLGNYFKAVSAYLSYGAGHRGRIGTIRTLFNKVLRLREAARSQASSGNVINLMLNDTSRMERMYGFFPDLIGSFLTLVVAIILLLDYIGVSSLIGVGSALVLMPVLIIFIKFMVSNFKGKMKEADERVRQTTEVLNGIKTIKMYAYEGAMWKRISEKRKEEMKHVRAISISRSVIMAFFSSLDIIILLFTFLSYTLMGNELNPVVVYQSITLFGLLRGPFQMLPMMFVMFAEMKVSSDRIGGFLSLPEKDEHAFKSTYDPKKKPAQGDVVLKMSRPVSFEWKSGIDRDLKLVLFSREMKGPEIKAIAARAKVEYGLMKATYNKDSGIELPSFKDFLKRKLEDASLKKPSKSLFMARGGSGGKSVRSGSISPAVASSSASSSASPGTQTPSVEYIQTIMGKAEKPEEFNPVLKDINISIKHGTFSTIVGKVGCGKTSFLMSLLGELNVVPAGAIPRHSQDRVEETEEASLLPSRFPLAVLPVQPVAEEPWSAVTINGSVSYSSQTPFILNASVRDNILFGMPYEKEKYERIVEACCLVPDLIQLKNGDLTEIGEKGFTLSGGQKARVSLARAVYSDSDILLLDDPLSAVDAHVAKRLVDDVFCGILKGRTILLVTHQVQYLPRSDRVIALKDGKVHADGSYSEIVSQGIELEGVFEQDEESEETVDSESEKVSRKKILTMKDYHASLAKKDSAVDKLISREEHAHGAVKASNYGAFIASAGIGNVIVAAVFLALQQTFGRLLDSWIADWSLGDTYIFGREWNGLTVYCLLAIVALLFSFIATIILMLACVKASQTMMIKMLTRILKAPMRFFETTPIGRIVNRFSKDTATLDSQIPSTLMSLLGIGLMLASMIIMQGIAVPPVLLVFILIAIIFFVLLGLYSSGVRELKRNEVKTRSPIVSKCNETMAGIVSVRAFNAVDRIREENDSILKTHMKAAYPFIVSFNWISFRLSLCGALLQFSVIAFLILLVSHGWGIEYAGMAVAYSVSFIYLVVYLVQMLAQLQADSSCIERITEYSTNVEMESQFVDIESEKLKIRAMKSSSVLATPVTPSAIDVSDAQKEDYAVRGESEEEGEDDTYIRRYTHCVPAPDAWPSKGEICVKDVYMRYRPKLPLVLNGISFTLRPGEKLGVCGKTGSGKSSLITALLRIVEPEAGQILVDGVDLSTLPLHDARSILSVIPQEGFLFSGTLRDNLDPISLARTGKHGLDDVESAFYCSRVLTRPVPSDEELWEVLRKVSLDTYVSEQKDQLDMKIADNGSNLSQGQRQLVCLARALLVGSKILLLDEATASLDNESDTAIQKVLREEFSHCTLLTVAHRLHTVIDFDRIMVLGDGRVLEIGSPHELLEKEGEFAFLVKETGKESEDFLRKKAKESDLARKAE